LKNYKQLTVSTLNCNTSSDILLVM